MSKLILMDGAVGTSLWEKATDKVPVWRYNLENPGIVTELHQEYIAAGSQIILANTFGANGMAVRRAGYTVAEVVGTGVRLAKEAAAGRVKVALSAGPLTGLLEPYGDITEEECEALYAEQLSAGVEMHPDLIYLQTFMDLEMLKIAQRVAASFGLPVFCSMSFDKTGHTMMGNTVEAVVEGLCENRLDAIGLNCSIGPDAAIPVMERFRAATDLPLIFKPNAGTPILVDGASAPGLDIEAFTKDVLPAVDIGVTYLGGCCGTNAKYIAALAAALSAGQCPLPLR